MAKKIDAPSRDNMGERGEMPEGKGTAGRANMEATEERDSKSRGTEAAGKGAAKNLGGHMTRAVEMLEEHTERGEHRPHVGGHRVDHHR